MATAPDGQVSDNREWRLRSRLSGSDRWTREKYSRVRAVNTAVAHVDGHTIGVSAAASAANCEIFLGFKKLRVPRQDVHGDV